MYINSIFLQSPSYQYDSEKVSQILCNLQTSQESKSFISNRIRNSGIARRNFVLPLEKIITLQGQEQRAKIFAEELPRLFSSLKEKNNLAINPQAIITTSCTMPALPAHDLELIKVLDITTNPLRIPVYQHGCLGGVFSLALASKLEFSEIFVCSYELCSLLFQNNDEVAQMMGAILFGDGIGAAVVSKTPKQPLLKMLASADYVIPKSEQALGYSISDVATKLVLSPQVPILLKEYVPQFVNTFLAKHGLHVGELNALLCHPGGPKILDNVFEALKIPREKMESSYRVLREHGNMSSASIFFVIDDFFKKAKYRSGEYVLILGVGPGVSLEAILCQIP